MKRVFMTSFVALAVLLAASACRSSSDLSRPETQRQFGVRMAKMNLWREAMFRFQRAVELEPQNAMAHNNLAVAYEAIGDFEAAAAAYREALRLDRSNEYIQRNYSRYVEFTQRSKRREARPAPATSAAATPAPDAAAHGDAAAAASAASASDSAEAPAMSSEDAPQPGDAVEAQPEPAADAAAETDAEIPEAESETEPEPPVAEPDRNRPAEPADLAPPDDEPTPALGGGA